MLAVKNSALVVIDMQEKLSRAMHDRENLLTSASKIVHGAKILGIPVIWTEQNPGGLGATLPEIRNYIPADSEPVIKLSFSCCAEPVFMETLKATGRKQILVMGIESHVCVCQTILDLLDMGYETHIVCDAVASRTPENKAIGVERSKQAGAIITSVEMALFELLGEAKGENFKQILKIVK